MNDINFPIDMRSDEDKDNDAHWQAYRDGDLNDCTCSLCQFWNEQNARDLERT